MEIELLGADGEVAGIGTVIQIVEWVGGLKAGGLSLRKQAQIESPEVMLKSFVSASSSRLDPC
jgi:hypothetical protein